MPNRLNYVYGTDRVEKLIERGLSVRIYCHNPPWICTHMIEITCHQFVEMCHGWGWEVMDDAIDPRLRCSKCGTRYGCIVIQQDAFGNPAEKGMDVEWTGTPPEGWVAV